MPFKNISSQEIKDRINVENVWWRLPHHISKFDDFPKRSYFDLFYPFVTQRDPHRALILMGPRRIGKTVMLYQAIQRLIDEGMPPSHICYLDMQTPLYTHMALDSLLGLYFSAAGLTGDESVSVFFDEIQYLPQWEVHLKNLVDRFPQAKFIASGSAAAALRLKSQESGAGRFTDFLLPPLTFYEYMLLVNKRDLITVIQKESAVTLQWDDVEEINHHFIDYINFGGYPEAVFSETVRANPGQYIRSDIIDKVLMKDLPSLYGIHDVQELNALFTMLAYNTGCEVSLDQLSTTAGVAKNTIKRYVEYLESAFLIKIVHRVDRTARRFKRANYFKVYLTNPCMRAALFSPLQDEDEGVGHLVETAVFSQWFHWFTDALHYARWDSGAGEVDVVRISEKTQKPAWALEVKWTDSCVNDWGELKSVRQFGSHHPDCRFTVTTKSVATDLTIDDVLISFWPSSVYSYWVGWAIIENKKDSKMPVSAMRNPAISSSTS